MNDDDKDLPAPESEDLADLLKREDLRRIYKYLYERRDNPPTMVEIRKHEEESLGESHAQTDRRLRELRKWFNVPAVRTGRVSIYRLVGFKVEMDVETSYISGRVRAEVLSSQRCAQCGKTPIQDKVRLQVDHKIPRSWGGGDGIENLQPLCTQCNHDKQDFYGTLDPYADKIKAASSFDSPHVRIGELLKAFAEAEMEAPAQVIEVVASMRQFQDDWQKRMRELRVLGWDYSYRRLKEYNRVMTYYWLTHWEEWPAGDVGSEIRRLEKLRKGKK